ncbi:MAG: hypothetical protein ACP6IY_14795 [Promethearchaeia archaeon]
MTINEILGFEDSFFYENVGFICIYSVLLFIIYLGLKFLKDGRKAEKGTPIRSFFIGLGLFIVSVAIGEGIYLLDLVFRSHTGKRLFLTLAPVDKSPNWQDIVGYKLASIINRDYYIVIFTVLLLSLSFLMKPLELFMLKREKPLFTYLNRILIPFPILIRTFEVLLYSIIGIKVVESSIPYYIFTALWGLVIIIMTISICLLIALYLKMAITAPKGSTLKKQSLSVILGILCWIITIFLTADVFRQISKGNWFYIPLIPALLLIAYSLLSYGFKREY